MGVSDAVSVTFSVSPFVIDFEAARAPDCRKVPPDAASQRLTWLTVSGPADHAAHDTAEAVIEPADGAANVTSLRVVSAEAFAVPAAPGSPVWSFAKTSVGAL
jgi:hypothetical protein